MTASPNELYYFLESAKTLSFSRAAERIGISQPSLSVAIKRLEDTIGVALFIRSKNGLQLTKAGQNLHVHAKKLINMWYSIKAESLASHEEVQGSLTLGCHPSVALHTIPRFVPDLLSQYPKLDIQLKHDLSRKILEGVISLVIDVGIVVNPVRHPDLILNKLYNDKISFYCAENVSNPRQLIDNDNTMIACDPDLLQVQSILNKLKKNTSHRIIATSNLELIATLAGKKNTIGILPATVAEVDRHPGLKRMSQLPSYQDEIYVCYRPENREIKAVNVLVNTIKKYLD